jgi:mRNA interferase RelE/StbE
VSESGPYAVVFTPAARRALAKLPFETAAAIYEHLTGPVSGNPRRLGKQLDKPLDGVWTTRRGEYRALYTIDDQKQVVTVLIVAHRRDAYRQR